MSPNGHLARHPRGLHRRRVSAVDYRLIDSAGSELELIRDDRPVITEGDTVTLSDGTTVEVLDVYDDVYGKEGGVVATLAVDVE